MARRKAKTAGEGDLVTFVPSVTFDGYPDGRTKVRFKADEESPPVPADYAELVRAKGLAPAETDEDNKDDDHE